MQKYLLLYDSHCPMCCSFLKFLDRHLDSTIVSISVCSSANIFAHYYPNFSTLISEKDIILLDEQLKRTIVLVSLDNGSIKLKSTAILCLFRMSTSFALRVIGLCLHTPRSIRDIIYDLTASNRFIISRLMGCSNACSLKFTNLKCYYAID